MNKININGHISAKDYDPQSVMEHALLETMLWKEGSIALWPYHYARLQNSFLKSGYNIQLPQEAFLLDEIRKTVQANDINEAKVRLITGIKDEALSFLIESIPYHHNDIPFRLCIAQNIIKEANANSGIKFQERNIYDSAMQEAKSNACDDVILLNQYGRIAETTIANIFWKQNNQTFTPPLSEGGVAGVYRQFYLDNHQVKETVLTTEMLSGADEIFLTNALRGIIKVENIVK